MTTATNLLCSGLNVDIAGRTLVRDLELTVRAGSIVCVLGCNGAGKTLTLHTLAGVREPAAGKVQLDDRDLQEWSPRARALRLGLLPQTTEDAFPATVLDTVLVGRHPHIGFWAWESEGDRDVARSALAAVGMEDFAEREISTLSGGERRRVAIASLLAQDPPVSVLDEPTNHLDPHHQLDVLRLMRARAERGAAVIMSLHDAGLAARFSNHALLLFGNGDWLSGPTAEVLTEASISRLYGVPVRELTWEGGRTFVAEA